MKKLLALIICNIICTPIYASVCADYLSADLSNSYKKQVAIIAKQENIEKYEKYMGKQFISSLIYGKGKMTSGKKTIRKIHYSCLMENDLKPVFGYVYKD